MFPRRVNLPGPQAPSRKRLGVQALAFESPALLEEPQRDSSASQSSGLRFNHAASLCSGAEPTLQSSFTTSTVRRSRRMAIRAQEAEVYQPVVSRVAVHMV
jgi:hypothetical protein